jgi:hypothetical protein
MTVVTGTRTIAVTAVATETKMIAGTATKTRTIEADVVVETRTNRKSPNTDVITMMKIRGVVTKKNLLAVTRTMTMTASHPRRSHAVTMTVVMMTIMDGQVKKRSGIGHGHALPEERTGQSHGQNVIGQKIRMMRTGIEVVGVVAREVVGVGGVEGWEV